MASVPGWDPASQRDGQQVGGHGPHVLLQPTSVTARSCPAWAPASASALNQSPRAPGPWPALGI